MKYVRKWTPVSSYDIQGLESWLQDLALQGLYLEQFRPLFCTFYSDAAKRTRYRIEPHHRRLDDDLPRSMLELYESYGWTCVGEIGRELLIFVTQEEDAPELHTDPELQGEQWRKLVRRLRRGFFLSLFCFLLITVFCAWSLFDEGAPVLVLLIGGLSFLLPALLFWVAGCVAVYELFYVLAPALWKEERRAVLDFIGEHLLS